jgi:hypothetical protein
MADKKLNQLPNANLPLNGDEYLLVDQDGLSKKIEINDLEITSTGDLDINALPAVDTPLVGDELLVVEQNGENKKLLLDDLNIQGEKGDKGDKGDPGDPTESLLEIQNLPTRIQNIRLEKPASVIDANGGVYEYIIDLGDTFNQVLLTNVDFYVKNTTNNNLPDPVIKNTCFPKTIFDSMILVSNDETQTMRLFELKVPEFKDGLNTPLELKQFAKKQDAGVVLGYGDITNSRKSVFLDHIEAYGKEVQIDSVFLNGTNLHVIVSNHSNTAIELKEYFGLSRTSPSDSFAGIFHLNIFGEGGIFLSSSSFGWGTRVSYDRGQTWQRFYADWAPPAGQATLRGTRVYEKTANNYFLAFTDYTWIIKELNLLDSTQFPVNLSPSPIWQYGYNIGERHLSRQGPSDYNALGRPLDINNDLAVLINFEQFLTRINVSTDNCQTFDTVFELEDIFSDFHVDASQYGPRAQMSIHTYTKLIDDSIFYAAFSSLKQNNEPINFFLKTPDAGNNLNEIMTHPEYKNAFQQLISISNNGQKIALVIIASDGRVLFNNSLDGGSTWTYDTGMWSEISDGSGIASQLKQTDNNLISGCALFQSNINIEEYMVILFNSPGFPIVSRTTDNGASWFPFDVLASTAGPNLGDSTYKSSHDANDFFVAFSTYGQSQTISEAPHWVGYDVISFTNWGAFGVK